MMTTDELYHFEHSCSLISDNAGSLSYKFIKHLQLGSYGKVILAHCLNTNQDVAIKLMSKPSKHSSFIARHELSILKRLASEPHQNICQLLNYFQSENYHWFVFEYCSNGDLYDYIANKDNESNPLHFKTLIKELVNVIKYSHSKGVYHRDIKPENILIDESKSIKLTDWGLATLSLNSTDPCVGTEKYMAPETFFKNPSSLSSNPKAKTQSYNTQTADYWSLGITLLYVLFKRCPWKMANLSDENFKTFVRDPYVLFDWYPKLSNFGFGCLLHLLQLNPIHRSIDKFYEASILDGFEESFIIDDTIKTESVEDDLLFGMDIDGTTATTTTTSSIEPSFKLNESDDSFMDIFDHHHPNTQNLNSMTTNSYFDDVMTPMTPALQTPMDLKIRHHMNQLDELNMNNNKNVNGSLHIKSMDDLEWY